MKKLKLLTSVIAVIALSFASSCGDDGPLKECIVCTYPGSSPQPEYCANKVTAETYKSSMESSGYTCVRK